MENRRSAPKIALFNIFVLSLALTSCAGAAVPKSYARGLKPPFDAQMLNPATGKADTKSFSCATPPESLRDLKFESIYGNLSKNNSVIDPAAYEDYTEDTESISQYQNGLTSMANRYLTSSPRPAEIAACTLQWLAVWAEEEALLGDVNRTGEFVRKWVLAPIALSYIQIRDEPTLNAAKVWKVEVWMRKVSKNVISDYSRDTDKSSRQNNHLYWAAWGVASAGVALNDSAMFDWAMEQARFGISQISENGTLPLEIERGRMALNYHIFAANPLMLLAEVGSRNGVDLYAENNSGLKRLAKRIISGINNPEQFQKMTGEKQDLSRALTANNLAWLEVYNARYPNTQSEKWLQKLQPMRNSRLGGNATLLYGR